MLSAEDIAVNQELTVHLLEKSNHEVEVAEKGREAVMAYEPGAYDPVLMDVQMPEMNGFEATRRIRGQEEGAEELVPIVAPTARATEADGEQCLDAGMDDDLSKPVELETLNHVVHEIAASRAPSQPRTEAEPPAMTPQ